MGNSGKEVCCFECEDHSQSKCKADASWLRLSCSNRGVVIHHADGFYCNLSSLCTKSRATHKEFSIFSREDAVCTKGEITCVCPPPLLSPFLKIQPIITLEGSVSHTFQRGGKNKVTVQVASGNAIVQDSRDITVKGECGGGGLQRALIGATLRMNMQRGRCRPVLPLERRRVHVSRTEPSNE